MNTLNQIRLKLKAGKNQFNRFGGYKYRSCEDILEAVKPLLGEFDATLTLTDDLLLLGEWVFLKATAVLEADGKQYVSTAFARLDKEKKGMDAAQLTGSASSYARKYALNALFLIDDAADPDAPIAPAQPETVAAPVITTAPGKVLTQTGANIPPPPPPVRK